jgi:two-component system response regulator HupR/HoxA
MMNWEELKHIHVVRKLQAILGQWFAAEIFFFDERGVPKNLESPDKYLDAKNPLVPLFLSKPRGRDFFTQAGAELTEKVLAAGKPSIVTSGPFGVEKVVCARMASDQDYYGTVIAFCYTEHVWTPEDRLKLKAVFDSLGLESQRLDAALDQIKPHSEADRKYMVELVELVAQEIMTFHLEISRREERIHELSNALGNRYSYDSMIGKSKPMQDVYQMLDKIKSSESTVLVQGENGTGKELIARAIHFNSPRKDAQFVTVNCSAFNENLLDSELFGHVKGSFTGAIKDKKGLFETADRGTLFLDEIGDMSLTMQVKLLRVLQEGTFTPVGSTELRKADVRVVAATNRNLAEMVEMGTFREDLYYRINVINLVVPPLRERKEDIPILIDHFLARGCKEKGVKIKSLAKRTIEKIYDYNWPGNIRELENEMERVIVLSGDEERIPAEVLSQRIRDFGEGSKVQGVRVSGKLKDALEELEKTMIREGLRRTGWNKSRLAKELGISRAGLIMKVEKYGLDKRKLARAGSDAA